MDKGCGDQEPSGQYPSPRDLIKRLCCEISASCGDMPDISSLRTQMFKAAYEVLLSKRELTKCEPPKCIATDMMVPVCAKHILQPGFDLDSTWDFLSEIERLNSVGDGDIFKDMLKTLLMLSALREGMEFIHDTIYNLCCGLKVRDIGNENAAWSPVPIDHLNVGRFFRSSCSIPPWLKESDVPPGMGFDGSSRSHISSAARSTSSLTHSDIEYNHSESAPLAMDEGYSTPKEECNHRVPWWTQAINMHLCENLEDNEPINFDSFHRTWETLGEIVPLTERIVTNSLYLKSSYLSRINADAVISCEELITDLKSVVIGLPSNSFPLMDGKLDIAEELSTHTLGNSVLSPLCSSFINAGNDFLKLQSMATSPTVDDCPFSILIKRFINNYLTKYEISVRAYSETNSNVLFFFEYMKENFYQIEYLTKILMPLPEGGVLMKILFRSMKEVFNKPLLALLVSLFSTITLELYLKLIKDWVFYGQLNPGLFIEQKLPLEEICDRVTLSRAFVLGYEYVPDFLFPTEVYKCGMNAVLLSKCLPYKKFLHQLPIPELKLVVDQESVDMYRDKCDAYYISSKQFFPSFFQKATSSQPKVPTPVSRHCSEPDDEQKTKSVGAFKKKEEYMLRMDDLQRAKQNAFDRLEEDRLYAQKISKQMDEIAARNEREVAQTEVDIYERWVQQEIVLEKKKRLSEWRQKRSMLKEVRLRYYNDNLDHGYCPQRTTTIPNKKRSQVIDIEPKPGHVLVQSLGRREDLSEVIPAESSLEETPPVSPPHTNSSFSPPISDAECDAPVVLCASSRVSSSSEQFHTATSEGSELETGGSVSPSPTPLSRFFSNPPIEYSTLLNDDTSPHCATVDSTLFEEAMKKSLGIVLKTQMKLTNEALMGIIMTENNFMGHIQRLQKYFFFQDGLFGMTLANAFALGIEEQAPDVLLGAKSLKQILRLACPTDWEYLSFLVPEMPGGFDHNDPRVLSCLQLRYCIKWPLNLIFTDRLVTKCNAVFEFFMCIERVQWHLKKLYTTLKFKFTSVKGYQYQQIHIHRHTMLHFVNSLKSYFLMSGVIESHGEFLKGLDDVENLDKLYHTTVKFIKTIRQRCLFQKSKTKVLEQVYILFRHVLVYCNTVRFGEWKLNETDQYTHTSYSRVIHTYNSFHRIAQYLIDYFDLFSISSTHHALSITLPDTSVLSPSFL